MEPRFNGGAAPSDWNYNTFCGHVFKYDDLFYLILPGNDGSGNYAKFGLYTSRSPLFPESDTEFKGIVFVGNAVGWEDTDLDMPWTVLFDTRMHLYYAACGSCWSQTGLAIIGDVPLALTEAYPPGNYINVDRDATASQQILPPVGWSKSISGTQEIDAQDFSVTLDPAVTGRAIVLDDGNRTKPLILHRAIPSRSQGVVSAWMRSSNTHTGDYDLYLYGASCSTPAVAVGLGGSGVFHYWSGAFVDAAVRYTADTWYLVTVDFDTATARYDFAVYDASFNQLLSVPDIDIGTPVPAGLDRIGFRTSPSFCGQAFLDDVVVRKATQIEPTVTVGVETAHALTSAWARTTQVLNSVPGSTIRWKYSARDASGNWATSDVYSFVTVERRPHRGWLPFVSKARR